MNDAIRTQPFDCPVGASAPACPGARRPGRAATPTVTSAGSPGSRRFTQTARSGPRPCRTCGLRLIADHGPAEGVARARALVTDGLRLSPANPSFLNMRDAILRADANRGLRDRAVGFWAVFAARGMGENAPRRSATARHLAGRGFNAPPPLPPETPGGNLTPDTVAPSISRFSMSRRRFRVGPNRTPRTARRVEAKPPRRPGGGGSHRQPSPPLRARGNTFRFRLSERATVRIALVAGDPGRRVGRRCRRPSRRLRGRARCTRYLAVGTLTRRDLTAGRRSVSFSGRVGARALRRGRHRSVIWATDAAGNRSRKRKLTFTIVRR